MKTVVKRAFLDIRKEEAWLNEQGEKGLMLLSYHDGIYEFEQVAPVRYQYRIDLPEYTGSKKKAYLAFLEQTGITVISEYAGRVYLRKNAADGPLELYTEPREIVKQMNKRYMHFFIIGINQILFGLIMAIYTLSVVRQRGAAFWVVLIVDVGVLVSGLIFLAMGIRKHRAYKTAGEADEIRL